MQALYWNGSELQLDSAYRAPVSNSETALVKVHLAGICSTDLQIFQGYMGFIGVPGHEFVGSVSEGPQELVGKRVVGKFRLRPL
jgi:threonine dehydrogenase-like Zn-dependent dehydrogenase